MMYDQGFLEGPEIPAMSGNTKKLVIFLHGYGSNGDDLISLAPFFQSVLPDAHFISPNGIEYCEMTAFGYQWFSLYDRSSSVLYKEAEKMRPLLDEFINNKLAQFGLEDKDLILIGFSQGTMTALHTALRRPKQIAGIIGFSGRLIAPEKLKHDLKVKPPICLIHGTADDVVDISAMYEAADLLQELDFDIEYHEIENLRHSIDDRALKFAVDFIKRLGSI